MADWAAAAAAWAKSGEGEKHAFTPPQPPRQSEQQYQYQQQQQEQLQHTEGWGTADVNSQQQMWMSQQTMSHSQGHHGFGAVVAGSDPVGIMGHQGASSGAHYGHGGACNKVQFDVNAHGRNSVFLFSNVRTRSKIGLPEHMNLPTSTAFLQHLPTVPVVWVGKYWRTHGIT